MSPSEVSGAKRLQASRITQGSLVFSIARFGLPLAIGMALQTTFNLVDAYLIAHLPASERQAAIGAIGISDQVAALGTIVSYGISTATATVLAQRRGAKDQTGIEQASWQSTLVIATLSLIFGLIGAFGAGVIVQTIIGAKGDVARVATPFVSVMTAGSFSIFFLLHFTTIARALGSSKTPVLLLVGGNALNVVLAILLIFGPGPAPSGLDWLTPLAAALHTPRLGMMGAAWATVVARSVALVASAFVVFSKFRIIPPRNLRVPKSSEIRLVASLAWPLSAQFVLRIAATLLVHSIVARLFTTPEDQTATTAMGLVFRIDTMATFVAMGWATAAQTFVGQNIGAGKPRRAKQSGWIAVAYSIVTSLLLMVLAMAKGDTIVRVFGSEGPAIGIAVKYLVTVAPSYVPLGLSIVLGHGLAGAGATRTTFALDVAVVGLVQVPLCVVVGFVLSGSIGNLFACVAITNVVSAIVYSIVYSRQSWGDERPGDRVPPSTSGIAI